MTQTLPDRRAQIDVAIVFFVVHIRSRTVPVDQILTRTFLFVDVSAPNEFGNSVFSSDRSACHSLFCDSVALRTKHSSPLVTAYCVPETAVIATRFSYESRTAKGELFFRGS
jgi:hypothetical protein